MPRAEELVVSGLARWGVFGREGTGKSTFLASTCMCEHPDEALRCPPSECLKTLVLSASIENKKPYLRKPHINVQLIDKWDDLDRYYRAVKAKPEAFQVLGFDTWTRMQALAALKTTRGNAAVEQVEQWLLTPPSRPANFSQWEQVGSLAAYGIQQFCQLPIHLIFLFQEEVSRPKTELDILEIGPQLTPAALRQVRTDLELIGRLYVDLEVDAMEGDGGKRVVREEAHEVRKLLIGKQDGFTTKGPTHALGRVIVNPTWAALAPSLS